MTDQPTAWIEARLPAVRRIPRICEPDFYGASWLIAAQLGREAPPRSYATWCHGCPRPPINHPRQILGDHDAPVNLVATEWQAKYLRQHGYRSVHAVGSPFVYGDKSPLSRRSGSLLVMPAHSLRYTEHSWDESAYARSIRDLKDRFEIVVACIQANCAERGFWIDEFQRQGIPCVVGASSFDANALIRMSVLFHSFEYVTTNAWGSHIPYAAYCGCKVSIYGPYAEPKASDYHSAPFYQKYPEMLTLNMAKARESFIREQFPELFLFPDEAIERVEWGGELCGAGFRRPAREIAKLLGWSWPTQLRYAVSEQYRRGGIGGVLAEQAKSVRTRLSSFRSRVLWKR